MKKLDLEDTLRYVAFRRWCNFSVPETWDDLTDDIPDDGIRAKLKELYGHPGQFPLSNSKPVLAIFNPLTSISR